VVSLLLSTYLRINPALPKHFSQFASGSSSPSTVFLGARDSSPLLSLKNSDHFPVVISAKERTIQIHFSYKAQQVDCFVPFDLPF
jgi:hypothetical protein